MTKSAQNFLVCKEVNGPLTEPKFDELVCSNNLKEKKNGIFIGNKHKLLQKEA